MGIIFYISPYISMYLKAASNKNFLLRIERFFYISRSLRKKYDKNNDLNFKYQPEFYIKYKLSLVTLNYSYTAYSNCLVYSYENSKQNLKN